MSVTKDWVLKIAGEFAGFSYAEADILRKAVGKKIKELLDEQRNKFINGAITAKGIDKKTAHEVWDFIEPFARYGFNRAHAACYAMIAYQTAYLKANYPAEFMAALLTCDEGNIDRQAIEVSEALAMDIPVLPPSINESQHQEILNRLMEEFKGTEEKRFDSIGPVVGAELKRKSISALVLLFIAIIVYIAFAFRRLSSVLSPWAMGGAAMVALIHDIAIPAGVFSFLGHYYGVEISAVFLAAALTILGYSVSDSVVVFDRIRENVLRYGKDNFGAKVHKSILQTLSRSINTSLTTLFSLFAIYFFGGESVKMFSLALIIGVFFGAYSSIFVASPIIVWMSKR